MSASLPCRVIVAADTTGGIGKDGKLPWHFKADMEYFRKLTMKASEGMTNAVIMGRKTWESIPDKFRPLKDRVNIIVTRNSAYPLPEQTRRASNLEEAIALAQKAADIDRIFIIGGGSVYKEALMRDDVAAIYMTRIPGTYDCDTFFPAFEEKFPAKKHIDTVSEGGVELSFLEYSK